MSQLDEQRLARFAEIVRTASAPTLAELNRGLQAVRASARRRAQAGSRRAVRLALAACGALSVVALVVALWTRESVTEDRVAVSRIEGGKMLEGGYLAEQGHAGVELTFSEGSRFSLSPGSRGRVRSITPTGARFAVDTGTAAFRITPSRDGEWWVEAGPFLVSVRGTDFTVGWEPTAERFELDLRRGRVAVSGPVVGEELVLKPGQRLSVDLPKGETVISDASAGASPDAPGSAVPVPPSAAASAELAPTTPRAPASTGAPVLVFREALARGEWDRILAEVERRGVAASLRSLPSEDLFALADAARYRKRTDLARSALLAQRARFPGSPRSLDALFLLGRVEEHSDARAALQRYEEYLARASAGTYAAEALGRKMILKKELEGIESARGVAREYLRRYPRGSYAAAARKLEELP